MLDNKIQNNAPNMFQGVENDSSVKCAYSDATSAVTSRGGQAITDHSAGGSASPNFSDGHCITPRTDDRDECRSGDYLTKIGRALSDPSDSAATNRADGGSDGFAHFNVTLEMADNHAYQVEVQPSLTMLDGHVPHCQDSIFYGDNQENPESLAMLDFNEEEMQGAHEKMEHEENLIEIAEITHYAVRDGNWSNPLTWVDGNIPSDDSQVLIPDGLTVVVDTVSDARLKAIRVDGKLSFSREKTSELLVETLFTTEKSILEIGSEENPIPSDISSTIKIISTTPGILPVDPHGRGVVTLGEVSIQGTAKTVSTTLRGNANAGDSVLYLDNPVENWSIGDKIVVAGTDYDPNGSDENNSRFQDEVLIITKIEGSAIWFENQDTGSSVLRYDHSVPHGYEDELAIPVGNLSRNVMISSEMGKSTEVPDRGHVMLMESDSISVRYASLTGLGRSNKDQIVDDPGLNVDGTLGADSTDFGENPRGRYALHLHRLGVGEEQEAAEIEGVAIDGSPGWGIVHHDSNANLTNNVVFDVLGSAIVAEAGNETGRWEGNLTIKTTGDSRDEVDFDGSQRVPLFDFGFNGEGYWIQGAPLIDFVGNTAASANGAALELFVDVDGNSNKDIHGGEVSVSTLSPEQKELFLSVGYAPGDQIPIESAVSPGLSDFTALNSRKGIEVWNHMRNDEGLLSPFSGHGHALRTVFDGFDLWAIFGEGIFTQYSTQLEFREGIVLGDPDDPVALTSGLNGSVAGRGIGSNSPTNDVMYDSIEISGFEVGMRLPLEQGGDLGADGSIYRFNGTTVRDVTISNAMTAFGDKIHDEGVSGVFPNFVELDRFMLGDGVEGSSAPVANFDSRSVGGRHVVKFDGGTSYDTNDHSNFGISGNSIAAYGWDFDGDGDIDSWGRWATFAFPETRTYPVSLTVWDGSGQATTITRDVHVEATEYANLLIDGSFSEDLLDGNWFRVMPDSSDQGWISTRWTVDIDGAAVAPLGSPINNGLFQVVADDWARRGLQELTFDLDYNYYSDTDGEHLSVAVWGFDSEFSHKAGRDGLEEEGAIEMDGELLFFERFSDTEGWESVARSIDFGEGFEFLTVSFGFGGRWGDENAIRDGDQIRIDNVAILDRDVASNSEGGVSSAMGLIGGGGTVELGSIDDNNWHRVNFESEIKNAVVVLGPTSKNGPQPVSLRVRDVDDAGFYVQVQEWDYLDKMHIAEAFNWMAVSEGVHYLDDGRTISAGRDFVDTTWDSFDFGVKFEDQPVVLGQVTSVNDPAPVAFRVNSVSNEGFLGKFREEEGSDNIHDREEFSWIAIESGASDSHDVGVLEDVTHLGANVSFETDLSEDVLFFAGMQSHNGGNPAVVRSSELPTAGEVNIFIEEERSADAEVLHLPEDIGYFAINASELTSGAVV